jgi:hypothetical protein
MTARESLAIGLFVVLALSGCFGGGADDDDLMDDEDMMGEPANAVISVLENGTVLAPADGTVAVPIEVELTFDGNASTGANASFFWDFGDGATALGAVTTHAYAEEGVFNVSLTVGSGNDTDTAALALNATVAVPAVPVLLETVPFTFSGSLPLPNPNAAMNEGLDHADHVVTLAATTTEGVPAVAREVRIHLESSGGAVATYLYWRSPDGTNLAIGQANSATQDIVFAEQMPPGDYVVRVRLFLGAAADYTITGEVDAYSS